MDNLQISIIIPTYNRESSLKTTLELYGRQNLSMDRFEVIVVDDGSTDATEKTVSQLQNLVAYRLRYFKQPNSGPALARNKGAQEAKADIVLFTGDDIFPKEDLLEQHLKTHKENINSAVLGFVEWSRDIVVTDFMKYLAPDGFQFRYSSITDSENCGFRHFYTSNISLGKKWFSEDRFDEDFTFASLEDTELGYRLEKKGLKIILNKEAIGYHSHLITLESFCEKMKAAGLSAAIFIRKHPELKRNFLPVNILFANIVGRVLKIGAPFLKINKKLHWHAKIVASYIDGLNKGLERQ